MAFSTQCLQGHGALSICSCCPQSYLLFMSPQGLLGSEVLRGDAEGSGVYGGHCFEAGELSELLGQVPPT